MSSLAKFQFLVPDYKNDFSKLPEINPDFDIVKSEKPFKNIVIDNFFKSEIHEQIKNETIDIPIDYDDEHKGYLVAPVDGPMLVGYSGDWHDAYRMYLNPTFYMKINIFMENRMHDFLKSFWPDILFTDEILLDLHHHEKFSRDGFVHNDFDPSRFYGDDVPFGVDISYENAGGEACDEDNEHIRYVQKSLAFIYWIGVGDKINENEPLGGETAIFGSDRTNPIGGFEMKENRMIMFEIGPHSFHGSRTNNNTYRDALFGWLHSEMDYMQDKYPNHDLCKNVRTRYNPSTDKSYGKKVNG